MDTFDFVVIGAGPGGTRAAFTGAALGMKTAIVECGFPGGTCLNVGCIPTKFLLGGTASLPLLRAQAKYGVAQGEPVIDLAALQERKDRAVKGTRQALEKQLAAAGITLVRGRAVFADGRSLTVKGAEEERHIAFSKCVIATGSVPASFPGLKPDNATVLSSASLLSRKEIPESLILVGGGAIGIELGEFFHRLGTRIILADLADRILPGEDEEVSALAHKYFAREGWEIHTQRKIASLTTEEGASVLRFEDGETLHAGLSLIAVGRRPNTAGLGAEAAGITPNERGWLATDPYLRVAEHIYAVGDVNGHTLLAHAADHQARFAARHAAGNTAKAYSPPAMPSCVYGTLEVMRVGPTCAQLQSQGKQVAITRTSLAANPIAQSYGHTQGFVKMGWSDGVLASVTAVGHGVSHLVTLAALLVERGTKKDNLPNVIFAHPTLDEAMESAMFMASEEINT